MNCSRSRLKHSNLELRAVQAERESGERLKKAGYIRPGRRGHFGDPFVPRIECVVRELSTPRWTIKLSKALRLYRNALHLLRTGDRPERRRAWRALCRAQDAMVAAMFVPKKWDRDDWRAYLELRRWERLGFP